MGEIKQGELRLQKYLALCGVASRRASEKIIQDGRVRVNDEIITEMGYKINNNDKIYVDNELISNVEEKIYIMLNKPVNVISSAKDQFNRTTVIDYVKDIEQRLYPVGRLDYDSKGLILLTNDGEFTNSIIHPSKEIVKTYIVRISGIPSINELNMLREGVTIDGVKTKPAKVKVLDSKKHPSLQIQIHEGRNRQVRKMIESIGFRVIDLERIAIGKLPLGNLEVGKWRILNEKDRALIFQ